MVKEGIKGRKNLLNHNFFIGNIVDANANVSAGIGL